MRVLNQIIFVAFMSIAFVSCTDDDTIESEKNDEIEKKETNLVDEKKKNFKETKTHTNLDGSIEYGKFDLDKEQKTSSKIDWDIAFYGTTLVVNGGEVVIVDPGKARDGKPNAKEPERTGQAKIYLLNDTEFENVTKANTSLFVQDKKGQYAIPKSGKGWYSYNRKTHLITPISKKVLVVKTTEGNHVKLEIISYYFDGNTKKPRYFSFKYAFIN